MRLFTGVFFIGVFCLGIFSANAQNGLDIGLLAGVNYSSYKYTGDEPVQNVDYDPGVGYYVGAFISVPMGAKLTFAPELLYSYQTATGKGDVTALLEELGLTDNFPFDLSEGIKLDAQESLLLLPLMFRMKLMKLDVGVGTQVGYSLSRNGDVTSEELNASIDIKDFYDEDEEDKYALNLNFDAGYYVTNHLKIGARYSYGLLLRNEVRISIWQVGLSYGFL